MNLIQAIKIGIMRRIKKEVTPDELKRRAEAQKAKEATNSDFTLRLNASAGFGRGKVRSRKKGEPNGFLRDGNGRKLVGDAKRNALADRPNPRRLGLHK